MREKWSDISLLLLSLVGAGWILLRVHPLTPLWWLEVFGVVFVCATYFWPSRDKAALRMAFQACAILFVTANGVWEAYIRHFFR